MDKSGFPPSIQSQDGKRKILLNESPSVALTDEWLTELGCEKVVAGKTFQGRDILLYWMDISFTDSTFFNFFKKQGGEVGRISSKNVLFLSLVHGNEPMGLTSLLMGAKELALFSSEKVKSEEEASTNRVYFIPIVNVDGYEANMAQGENLEERGCHRPNLRETCNEPWYIDMITRTSTTMSKTNATAATATTTTTIPIPSCASGHSIGVGGVDLNRNFPFDWQQFDDRACYHNYPGPHPLSEPESQTIAKVVQDFNITAAMSLHSRKRSGRQALLIHPYASDRSFRLMNQTDARRFRDWSDSMNENSNWYYRTGTAFEAIEYTAGGTTIDWMYSYQQVVSFVLEAVPPCDIRWCLGDQVYRSSQPHANTMVHFARLALFEENYHETLHMFPLLMLILLLLSGIFCRSAKRRHCCRLFMYRFGLPALSKQKEEITQEEKVELMPLNV